MVSQTTGSFPRGGRLWHRKFCQPESKVKFFFDVYDLEERVL